MIRKTSFNPPLWKTNFNRGGRETNFNIGGMITGFEVRGIRNDIQQVGISGMIHTRGIDYILSVQYGSDKNHTSVDQMNLSTEGYVTFLVILFFGKT